MKRMLLLAGVAALFASDASASVFTPYLAAKARYAFMDSTVKYEKTDYNHNIDMDKNIFGGSVAFGLRANSFPALRGELEYSHNKDIKKTTTDGSAKTQSHYVLLNMYYDFRTCTKFTPYLSAGLGGSSIKYSVEDVSDRNNRFAWQLGAGISYNFTPNIVADAGYRYVDLGHFSRAKGEAKTRVESDAHEIYLGVRYMFE